MKLEQFVELIAGEFEETAPELFTPETRFKDLEEWGSLTALSIISVIDDEFDVTVTGADLRKHNTIQDLFELTQK